MRFPSFIPVAAALFAALPCATFAQQSDATVEQIDDAVIFTGRITQRSVAQFVQIVQDPKVTRLVITSRGGLVGPALDMGLAVHERGLDVEVPRACLSSCANYVFPAGRTKTLGRADAVAWHGNMTHVLYLQQTGQGNWSEKEIDDARQLARREVEFFRRVGVDGFVCWFGKIEPYNVADFYALAPQDMERFGIHDVWLRHPATEAPADDAITMLQVDWSGIKPTMPAILP